MNHDSLVILRYRVKGLLDHMATKGIHGEIQGIATDSISNLYDLLRSSMLEATLNQKIAKAINHERIGLSNNGFDDIILLLCSTNFELLLEENRSLLVIIANNLVDNVLPVAVDSAVKEAAIVERLRGR